MVRLINVYIRVNALTYMYMGLWVPWSLVMSCSDHTICVSVVTCHVCLTRRSHVSMSCLSHTEWEVLCTCVCLQHEGFWPHPILQPTFCHSHKLAWPGQLHATLRGLHGQDSRGGCSVRAVHAVSSTPTAMWVGGLVQPSILIQCLLPSSKHYQVLQENQPSGKNIHFHCQIPQIPSTVSPLSDRSDITISSYAIMCTRGKSRIKQEGGPKTFWQWNHTHFIANKYAVTEIKETGVFNANLSIAARIYSNNINNLLHISGWL